ncbi:unnamed protein product [Oppiella nova]|uniref:Rab-GAP TBC domain-containing protein n=1 Tax=Oppiella nova TaxID=334625 RepID=A0A7R9LQ16_9ACAR|nr:unnamed protein product [Oppiella nova]CAG2165478.1 unnamed protein product [Oppiella nova]
MCDCIHLDPVNGSNANEYNEKALNVSQIKDKSVVVSDKEPKCKGIVVSIESIDGPTIDAVLDKVPLVYDPITKQLLLQKGFANNNGVNGYKNGVNLQNGFKRLNGFLNLNHENSSHESNDKTLSCDEYSSRKCENNISVDNSLDDKLKALNSRNSYSVVDCKQSPNDVFERRTESHSCVDNKLSVFHSNKDHTLEATDGEYNGNNLHENNGSDDSISNVDSSVLSLNLDTESNCESVSDSKPKKLFTLSLQSLLNKVKRNNTSNVNNSNSFGTNGVNISSTTALILETRPPHLPAKHPEEDKKHKQEFEEMIRQTRKKELKDMKAKKRMAERQRKQEEQVIEAIKVWNTDLLPNWHKNKNSKKTRDLWWSGIPSHVRQRVWTLAITNDLNITEDMYSHCVSRSKENVWSKQSHHKCVVDDDECCNESAADLIKLDVSRTFPQLGLFQESGPYHEVLSELLGAYVTYRPDIGYAQGMSFLAAMLLLNMESESAFVCLANLLNRELLVSFFRVNQPVMNAYYKTFEEFFAENLPKLYKHFNEQKLSPDLYLVDYIYTLFSRSLPLDIASRIWDLFLRDGEEFIFRAALGILSMYYEVLLNLDFIYLAQFLTKLPEDMDSDKLFSYISGIHMTSGAEKTSFSSVLSTKLLESNNL